VRKRLVITVGVLVLALMVGLVLLLDVSRPPASRALPAAGVVSEQDRVLFLNDLEKAMNEGGLCGAQVQALLEGHPVLKSWEKEDGRISYVFRDGVAGNITCP